jgi:hypothetical protein
LIPSKILQLAIVKSIDQPLVTALGRL